MKFLALSNSTKFENKNLVLATVGIGNIGQLSLDYCLNQLYTLKKDVKLIGYLEYESLLPMSSQNPFEEERLSMPLEVYAFGDWILLQCRSFCIPVCFSNYCKGKSVQFVQDLLAWIAEQKFKFILSMSSADGNMKTDAQLRTNPCIRFISNPETAVPKSFLSHFNIKPLESEIQTLYGSGVVTQTLHAKHKDLNILILCLYCQEGDNYEDGVFMGEICTKYILNMKPEEKLERKVPKEWSYLYGQALSREQQSYFF